jgi:hypothetical protein
MWLNCHRPQHCLIPLGKLQRMRLRREGIERRSRQIFTSFKEDMDVACVISYSLTSRSYTSFFRMLRTSTLHKRQFTDRNLAPWELFAPN